MTITLLAPDGVPVTAQQERQAKAAQHGGGSGRQLGGRSGFRIGTPSNVLTATSTTWTLGPCAAMLDPGASTHQGMYGWASDANVTGGVTAADGTNPRKDIVYIQISDSTAGDGSGAVNASVKYLAGQAVVNAQPPALPARSFLIGTITVPQVCGGSPSVVRNPAVYVAAGAPLPVSSQAERDALVPYPGLVVTRLDLNGASEIYTAAGAWRLLAGSSTAFAEYGFQGNIGTSVPAGGTRGPFGQLFPAGRFTVPPIIVFGGSNNRHTFEAVGVSAQGFDLYVRNNSSQDSVADTTVWYVAKQMTPTSAMG